MLPEIIAVLLCVCVCVTKYIKLMFCYFHSMKWTNLPAAFSNVHMTPLSIMKPYACTI